jgi:hypothetical protein
MFGHTMNIAQLFRSAGGNAGRMLWRREVLRGTAVLSLCYGIAGCCTDVGYPAISLRLRDAVSGEFLPLAGAQLTYLRPNSADPVIDVIPNDWPGAQPRTICCRAGVFVFTVLLPGYEQYQDTVHVGRTGFCGKPVLRDVVFDLQPVAARDLAAMIASLDDSMSTGRQAVTNADQDRCSHRPTRSARVPGRNPA